MDHFDITTLCPSCNNFWTNDRILILLGINSKFSCVYDNDGENNNLFLHKWCLCTLQNWLMGSGRITLFFTYCTQIRNKLFLYTEVNNALLFVKHSFTSLLLTFIIITFALKQTTPGRKHETNSSFCYIIILFLNVFRAITLK